MRQVRALALVVAVVLAQPILGGCSGQPSSEADGGSPSTQTYDCEANWKGNAAATESEWFYHCDPKSFVTASPVTPTFSPTEEPTEQPTEAPTQEPSDEPEHSTTDAPETGTQTALITDSDGYTFRIDFEIPTINVSASIANSKPGRTDLEVTSRGSATIMNTTDGRNAPVYGIRVLPVWADSSPVCSKSDSPALRDLISHNADELGAETGFGYCTLEPVAAVVEPGLRGPTPSQTLAPWAERTTEYELSTPASNIDVSEEASETIIEALRAPDGWMVGAENVNRENRTVYVDFLQGGTLVEVWRSRSITTP